MIDFQQRRCPLGNEILVKVENVETHYAPTGIRTTETNLNSNRDKHITKTVNQTQSGHLVEGSLNKEKRGRISHRHVQSLWGPPRNSQSSIPLLDSYEDVNFKSLFVICKVVCVFVLFFLQLQRITHSNCIKPKLIAKSGSPKRCCYSFWNRHPVVYLCFKKLQYFWL